MHFTLKHIFLIFLFCTATYSSSQQISVDNTLSVETLVENTLNETCIEINNINSPFNGNVSGINSFGFFERGSSNFPFQNGIVITSGNANFAGNGLNTEVLNEGNDAWGTDPDLENTLGINGTQNATTIAFNFTSVSNTLQFNYILASEEYFANYPCNTQMVLPF